jgi:hypothetical protein
LVIVQTERRLKTWLNEVMKFGLKAIMYYGKKKNLSPRNHKHIQLRH